MAETLTFDFTSRGAPGLQRDFKQTGDNAALAAKGARILADQLEAQRKASDSSVRATLSLAKADKLLEDAEHALSDEALKADYALRREADAAQKAGRASEQAAGKGGIGALVGSITGFSDATGTASSKGTLFARALSGISLASGLAEPAAAALVVAAGGLGAAFTSAAVGLGAFGVVAGQVFAKSSDAASKASAAQEAYKAKVAAIEDTYKRQVAAATNASQVQAAQATRQSALQAALKSRVQATTAAFQGLTKPQIQLAHAIQGVKDQWNAFTAKATPGVASVLEKAFGVLPDVFKTLGIFLPPVEAALKVIIGDVKDGLESPYWQRFISFLSVSAVPAMIDIAKSAGNIAHGIAGILEAFAPVQQSMTSGLVSLTAKFAKWGETLSSHNGFQSLMSEWQKNWPLMRTGLERFAVILKNIGGDIFGLSTPANSKALWQIANPILAAVEALSAHPALVNTLLYLLAIGKAGGQIKGVFESLKSGWNTLAGVISALTGGKISLGMQGAGDTMLVASQNMLKAADLMAGAGAAGGAAGGAAAAGESAGAAAGAGAGRAAGKSFAEKFLPLASAAILEVAFPIEAVAKIFGRSFTGEIKYMWDGPAGFKTLFINPAISFFKNNLSDQAIAGFFKSHLSDQAIRDFFTGATSVAHHGSTQISGDLIHVLGPAISSFRGAMESATTAVQNGFRPQLDKLHAATPAVKQDMDRLASSIQATGTKSAQSRSDRQEMIADLERSGVKANVARGLVNNYINRLQAIPGHVSTQIMATGSGSGRITFKDQIAGQGAQGFLEFHAKGYRVPGYGGGDTYGPVMVERGETIVPKYLTPAVAPLMKAHGVPGFASGGLVGGSASPLTTGGPFEARHEQSFYHKAFEVTFNSAREAFRKLAQSFGGTGKGNLGIAERAWIGAGGPGGIIAHIAGAITGPESGFNPLAVQQGQPYATTGWGAWQITPGNSEPQFGVDRALLNWHTNALAAVAKYRGAGGSFLPWTTFVDGAYLNFMDSGGTLRPGMNHVWNGTGGPERLVRPEHAVTPAQAARGGGGHPTVVIHVGGSGSHTLDSALKNWIKQTVRVDGGGDVQVAFG